MATRHDSMVNPGSRAFSIAPAPSSRWSRWVPRGPARSTPTSTSWATARAASRPRWPPSARKPLSIAFEEIAEGLIVPIFEPEDEDADGAEGRRRRSRGGRRGRRELSRCRPGGHVADGALAGARIVLGVSGGIAAYKAVEVCRRLVDAGAHVAPVLTEGALRFVGAHHLRRPRQRAGPRLAVRRRPTPSRTPASARPPTSSWSRRPRPACSGCYAAGISDDLLTNTLLATRAPVLVAPAMHTEMWEHAAVQDNLAVAAAPGRARGRAGVGPPGRRRRRRRPPGRPRRHRRGRRGGPRRHRPVGATGDLAGLKVLVTAGGTREPIDPVRFISNRPRASRATPSPTRPPPGAPPSRWSPPSTGRRPAGVEVVRVDTAAEMADAVLAAAGAADVVVMAAAVADFRPVQAGRPQAQEGRRRRPRSCSSPPSTSSPSSGERKRPGQVLVGFAAETDDVRANAADKLRRKGADLIVANDVSAPGRRLRARHQRGHHPRGTAGPTSRSPCADKRAVAGAVLDAVVDVRSQPISTTEPAQTQEQREQPLHLHLGVGHRGPSRQDGRPDLRRRPRRHPRRGPDGRVACETMVTTGLAIVAGEITTEAYVDIPTIVRETINGIGYDRESFGFDGNTCGVITSIDEQSPDIAQGVDTAFETRTGTPARTSSTPRAPATRG